MTLERTSGIAALALLVRLPAVIERHLWQLALAFVLLIALAVAAVLAIRWVRAHARRVSEQVRTQWRRVAASPRFARARGRYPRAWAFVAARFSRGEYLGLHLTVGLALSIGALWLFGGVTEDVINHDPLTVLDLQLASWFRAHATHALDRVALVATNVGSPTTVAVLVVLVAVALAARRWWFALAGWLAANGGGAVLDAMVKRIIHRPRPEGAAAFLHATPLGISFSFPSGHAMGSLIAYGMLGFLLVRFWPAARRHAVAVAAVTLALILLIGLTRLYLGVHYLSDVIGGYAAGIVWLTTCITGVEIAAGQHGLSPWEVGLDRRRMPRSGTRSS